MFSFAKFIADLFKTLGISAKITGYAISAIVIGGGAWYLSHVYYQKNNQLNQVDVLNKKVDIVLERFDKVIERLDTIERNNNSSHKNFDAKVSNGFGEVNILFKRTTEYYDQRFNVLDKNQKSNFEGQRKWLNEEIDKLLNFTISEKKNESPYRLTSIP